MIHPNFDPIFHRAELNWPIQTMLDSPTSDGGSFGVPSTFKEAFILIWSLSFLHSGLLDKQTRINSLLANFGDSEIFRAVYILRIVRMKKMGWEGTLMLKVHLEDWLGLAMRHVM